MNLRVRFLAIGGTIAVISLASGFALKSFLIAEPLAGQVDDYPSPDLRWVATLEEVDNGAGFGLGMLYDEVHIHHPDEKITDHIDDRSVIFCANATGDSRKRPQIKWIDSTHLLITYDPARIDGRSPEHALREFHGIGISYDTDTSI
jgi:hypothetical protein